MIGIIYSSSWPTSLPAGARTLIEAGGYLGLKTRFRYVLYNGERLTLESADHLDKVRAIHRRLPRR